MASYERPRGKRVYIDAVQTLHQTMTVSVKIDNVKSKLHGKMTRATKLHIYKSIVDEKLKKNKVYK